jgi:formamidopyrimidine-DNA glycosylase
MPELPEVEVTRLSFADRIAGARIESVRLGKPLRWPLGCEPAALVGRTVRSVRRRGKYLLLDLDRGLLLLHLGMSGSLRFDSPMPEAALHDHFDLATSRGVLRLNDPRRFGAVVYCNSEAAPEAVKLLGRLGAAQGTDQAGAAGRRPGGRGRQHLCIGGAVPGRDPADDARVAHQPAAGRPPAAGDP